MVEFHGSGSSVTAAGCIMLSGMVEDVGESIAALSLCVIVGCNDDCWEVKLGSFEDESCRDEVVSTLFPGSVFIVIICWTSRCWMSFSIDIAYPIEAEAGTRARGMWMEGVLDGETVLYLVLDVSLQQPFKTYKGINNRHIF